MFGHAAAVLAAMGTCAAAPGCTRPAVILDDNEPTVRVCAHHATAALAAH